MNINILLFHGFETLDVFGPVEVLGHIESFHLEYYSMTGEEIASAQGTRILTKKIGMADKQGILVVPGGRGTRALVENKEFLQMLKNMSQSARYILSICTGSALLAKAGVLDGVRATSNKNAFDWVRSTSNQVEWEREPRWIADGRYYTSAGVSAGIDMAFGFIRDLFGEERAKQIAKDIEYKIC